jgi:hypothetical protein
MDEEIREETLTNSMSQIVPVEKITVAQLFKICRAFYGTRKVITVFTRAPLHDYILI